MDIEAIKSTTLGRAWVSAFVGRVWDDLGQVAGRLIIAKARLARSIEGLTALQRAYRERYGEPVAPGEGGPKETE